ncbi:MAG: hypothetical protein KZQ77_18210 [Candidatus Thiodiazotropha sp. (ex Notomyrtea botanica)]|nr:hypothetical protein [Candidatus Thiodiazotropha sp. (ex Notomyrtea botanica)]
MWTYRFWIVLVGMLMMSPLGADDWRYDGSQNEKILKLIEVLPGTSHWMFEIGERYKNLYWAAKLAKWEFAEYQVEEIEKLVQLVQLTRPKRAETAQVFIDDAIPQIEQAVESKEWTVFEQGFQQLSSACMQCHVENEHAFITLPAQPDSASSPVLNIGVSNR